MGFQASLSAAGTMGHGGGQQIGEVLMQSRELWRVASLPEQAQNHILRSTLHQEAVWRKLRNKPLRLYRRATQHAIVTFSSPYKPLVKSRRKICSQQGLRPRRNQAQSRRLKRRK